MKLIGEITMKAVVCKEWGPPESLVIEDIPSRNPGPGEVKISIKAAGVNFPDALIIQNKYQYKPQLPFIPGSEVAGEILAVGEGVTHLKPGNRVSALCMLGGFAEEVIVPAEAAQLLPESVSFDVAAAFSLTYGTSYHALKNRASLQLGESLLILGAAGGVGIAAIELGKALGARVIAAASSDDKLATCKAHGADELINYEKEDLRTAIKRVNQDKPVDVVYDAVGGKFTEPAVRSLAWRGRYLVVGFASGEIPTIPLNLLLLKGSSLVGVFWGEFIKREPKQNAANIQELSKLLEEGKLKPLISHSYKLENTAQALIDLSLRKVSGKVVITP